MEVLTVCGKFLLVCSNNVFADVNMGRLLVCRPKRFPNTAHSAGLLKLGVGPSQRMLLFLWRAVLLSGKT